jgi:hypothetical protein
MCYLCHGDPSAGHFFADKTLVRLEEVCYFPGMKETVTRFVASCHLCNLRKYAKDRRVGLVGLKPLPERYAYVHCDLLGPFPETAAGNSLLVVFTDVCTHSRGMWPVTSTSRKEFLRAFEWGWYAWKGVPSVLYTDKAKALISDTMAHAAELYGFQLKHSAVGSHESNGLAEQVNRTIEEQITFYSRRVDRRDWDLLIPSIKLSLAGSFDASRGTTPFYLENVQHVRLGMHNVLTPASEQRPLEDIVQEIRTRLAHCLELVSGVYVKHTQVRAATHNATHKDLRFQPDDLVYVDGGRGYAKRPVLGPGAKLYNNRGGPWRVLQELPDHPGTYRLRHVYAETVIEVSARVMRPYSAYVRLHETVEEKKERNAQEAEPDGAAIAERIVDMRGQGRTTVFRIRWRGYDERDDTWEPADHLRVTDDAGEERINFKVLREYFADKPALKSKIPGWLKRAWDSYEDAQRGAAQPGVVPPLQAPARRPRRRGRRRA